ncbi:MAG: hypothetical protein GYA41_14205 [Bacteroidales bacterium]|nr:hypothetical protein [Bacteroidales bacterium]
MKRIKILLPVLLAIILPSSFLNGQEKKTEKRIKVVVADKNGPEVVIDTTFSGIYDVDSVRLKDGSIIYLGKNSLDAESDPSSQRKEVFITAVTDKKGEGKSRNITVICSDSLAVSEAGGDEGTRKVIIRKSGRDGKKGAESYIYVNEYENDMRNSTEADGHYFDDDIIDKNTDRTKFVIASKGMVVTIEGDDEALAEDLRKEIEKKLNSNPE